MPHLSDSPPQRSVMAALFDTRFETFVTPVIVGWIYRACILGIGVATVAWFVLAWSITAWRHGAVLGVLAMLLAPSGGFVCLLVARVACEFVLSRFRP